MVKFCSFTQFKLLLTWAKIAAEYLSQRYQKLFMKSKTESDSLGIQAIIISKSQILGGLWFDKMVQWEFKSYSQTQQKIERLLERTKSRQNNGTQKSKQRKELLNRKKKQKKTVEIQKLVKEVECLL